MVRSTFSRSGWNIVRSALLAKGGTLKKRPLLHLHKVPIWSNKVSPRNFQVALILAHSYYGKCTEACQDCVLFKPGKEF
jgi:hypothetical protein